MQDSKVITQIAAMDGRERERLRQFVDSPYFNRHEGVRQLLGHILGQLGRARPKLTEKDLLKSLAPADSPSIPDLLSALMKLVNRFLAVEQLGEETFEEEVLTLKRSNQLQRVTLLENRGKRLDRRLKKSPYRNQDLHLAAYQWKAIIGYRKTQEKRKHTPEFQHMLDHLDRFWLVEKLRHACHLTANMMLMNTHYDFLLMDDVMAYLGGDAGAKLLEKEQSIDCYYQILMALREPDRTEHYQRMRYHLDEGVDRLPQAEQKDLFVFATNYCILRIMSGHADYRRELFDLYRRALETGTIYDKDEISEWNYKNVVTLGTGLGEVDWTEAFIENHRERLPAPQRDNAYALNKAQFLYATQRLDEAAEQLAGVTDNDVKYHQARVLLRVQIAYDQAEDDYATNLLETFRLYVRRNRNVSTKEKRSYINFVRFAKQLFNLRFQGAYMDREAYARKLAALHEHINSTELLAGRQWLVKESQQLQPAGA